MTLGERIKFVRKNNHLSQIQFADLLGISQTHVSKIENGAENPSETLLLFISYKFAVNIQWLKSEQGNYDGGYGCSADSYFDKLIYVRHKMERAAACMASDSIWEYVDSIANFEHLLDCCDIKRVNDPEVRVYYKKINRLMFHLSMLTTGQINVKRPIEEVKEIINNDINELIEIYSKI